MKAFLSHSSKDKQFVRAVAKELGRQYCVFDEQSFTTGDEFKASIEQGLDESSIFVLFASRQALKSVWVEFEIEEAWYRNLHKILKKSLVYLIESNINVDNLPEWLRRALIRRQNSPQIVAREIRHHLDEMLREKQHVFFVGRSYDIEKLEQALTPLDGSIPPHAICITGLPGIGRRSLLRRIAPTTLNLNRLVEFRVGDGYSVNDICVSVADRVEPYSTKQGFERLFRQIQVSSREEALQRILRNLRKTVHAGELPVFFDEGGLLDSDGYIQEPIQSIFQALEANDDAYIFFVSSRRPQFSPGNSIPVIHLDPLKESEIRRLISLLAHRADLKISPSDVSELADYVTGYPPAAYFAIQQVKDYGLELIMAKKARLVQFRTDVFLRHFANLNFNANEKDALRLLAIYSPLPLSVIAKAIRIDLRSLNDLVVRMIDLALIITTEDGHYRIADPVADAAVTAFGLPTEEQHQALAKSLNRFLKESKTDLPRLELSRVLFRAARLAKADNVADTALHLANDLIKLTETFYHSRRYSEAVKVGYTAVEERPNSVDARSYLIRALIQEEKWVEADEQIENLKIYAPLREVYFLRGFLERNQGDLQAAIENYEEARRSGRKGVAINRELAFCYFRVGNLEQASRYIDQALIQHGSNRYVVDLWIQIATRQRDEESARKGLDRLREIDHIHYYYHRLSRVEFSFTRLQEALTAARQAVDECSEFPPFEILAQLAICEIESENLKEATKILKKLDKNFGHIRRDIRMALRCRFEIKQERYREALLLSERIDDKNTPSFKKIRLDALEGELLNSVLEDELRATYEDELYELKNELVNFTPEQFLPIDL